MKSVDNFLINGYKIQCKLLNITIDLPTIGKLIHFKNFNGMNSCIYCDQHGTYIDNKVVFPIEKFTTKKKLVQIQNLILKRNGFDGIVSPLFELKEFVIHKIISVETMHQLLIGIGKFMLKQIHLKESPIYIKSKYRTTIEIYFKKVSFPSNYNKIISGIKDQKAFQNLLIFLYFFKLFKICNEAYEIIELFSKILDILYSDLITDDDINMLQDSVDKFLVLFQTKFKKEKMTKNVHNLNHLVKDVINLGSPKFHNMFCFENFNHLLNLNIFTNNYFEKQLIQKWGTQYTFDDDLSDDLFEIYKKFKVKNKNIVKVNNMYLKNGDYIEASDGKIYKIKDINNQDEFIFLKNPQGVNDIVLKKEKIISYMIKSYEYFQYETTPKKIFFKDKNLSYII